MRITSKGQVTIPIEMRERYGLLPGTEVELGPTAEGVLVRRAEGPRWRGRSPVEHVRGRATRRLSTDEIMALTRGE